MKRSILFIVGLFLLSLVLPSCSSDISADADFWGATKYYPKFLFVKEPPQTMTRTLECEFGEYATYVQEMKCIICEKDENENFVQATDINVYKNGELCKDGVICIKHEDSEIELTIEFQPYAKRGNHSWYLKIIDDGGLDRVNGVDTDEDLPMIFNWYAKKVDRHNPLAEGSLFTLIALIAALIAAIVLCRINNPAFKVARVYVTDEVTQKTLRLSGASAAVLSSKKQKQSFFSVIFKRKIVHVNHDFFTTGDVTIEPKFRIATDTGRVNGIRISGRNYEIESQIVAKDETTTIKNLETNQKITISVQ